MMRQHRGVVYADVECNMLHISVSYNTELREDVQDLVCMQLPFIYTLKKGGLYGVISVALLFVVRNLLKAKMRMRKQMKS